jgi:hypothetical protein
MFRVQVALADAERLVATIDAMQAWFKRQEITPATFGYSLGAASTLFRVDFAEEADALAFAAMFHGALVH